MWIPLEQRGNNVLLEIIQSPDIGGLWHLVRRRYNMFHPASHVVNKFCHCIGPGAWQGQTELCFINEVANSDRNSKYCPMQSKLRSLIAADLRLQNYDLIYETEFLRCLLPLAAELVWFRNSECISEGADQRHRVAGVVVKSLCCGPPSIN